MRSSSSVATIVTPPSKGQEIADTIDMEPVKMKNYGDKFFYHPVKVQIPELVQTKSTEEYLQTHHPGMMFQKPEYEKEELVKDHHTGRWILVKESDMYKYIN